MPTVARATSVAWHEPGPPGLAPVRRTGVPACLPNFDSRDGCPTVLKLAATVAWRCDRSRLGGNLGLPRSRASPQGPWMAILFGTNLAVRSASPRQKAPGGSPGTPGSWARPFTMGSGTLRNAESPGFRRGLLAQMPCRTGLPWIALAFAPRQAEACPTNPRGSACGDGRLEVRPLAARGNLGLPRSRGSPPGPWMALAFAPAHPFGPASAYARLGWRPSHRPASQTLALASPGQAKTGRMPVFRVRIEKKRTRGWGNHGSGSGYRGVGLWGGEQPLKRIVVVRWLARADRSDT